MAIDDNTIVMTLIARYQSDLAAGLTADSAALAGANDAISATNGRLAESSIASKAAIQSESPALLLAADGTTLLSKAQISAAETSAALGGAASATSKELLLEADAATLSANGSKAVATSALLAGDSSKAAATESSLLGKEFIRFGDTANIAGARLRVFDSATIGLAGNLTLLALAVIAVAVKEFSDFQLKMRQVGAEAGLTKDQVASLSKTVLQMGQDTPTAVGELADGFRHIVSEGYNLQDSIIIAKSSLEAADAQGASFAETASTVATEMRNWGDGANKAAQDTGALFVASQAGNTNLQGLVGALGKIGPTAAAIHMPLSDAVSLVAELTRATGDPSLAQTYAEGMLTHIISPTKIAITVMQELEQTTGIDLLKAFHQSAARQISFASLMDLTKEATHGNAAELMALFGGIRGGIGALQLMNGGLSGYVEISKRAKDGTRALDTASSEAHDTLAFKFGVAINDVKIKLIETGGFLNSAADGIARTATAGTEGSKKLADGVTTLSSATDGSRQALENQIRVLERQKTSLEASGTSAKDDTAAGGELAGVLSQLASLQEKAAEWTDYHTGKIRNQAQAERDALVPLGAELALRRQLAGVPAPGVYVPPTDKAIASQIATANQNVTTAQNRLAFDEINKHTQFLAKDREELAKAIAARQKWDDALGKSSSGVDAWTSRYQAAQKAYTDALDRVRLDIADPKRHGDLAAAREEEARAATALRPFNDAIKATTASTSVHKTSLDALQRVQEDLAKAEKAVYADIQAGRPITAAQRQRIIEDTAEIKKMTDAVAGLTGKLKQPVSPGQQASDKALAAPLVDLPMGIFKQLLAQAQRPIETFADGLDKARKTAADWADSLALKMYDLEHGIKDDLPPLSFLEKGAGAAAASAADYAKIQDKVNAALGSSLPWSEKLSAAQQAAATASDLVSQKMYDLENGIKDNLPPLSVLETRAAGAANKVTVMENAANDAATALKHLAGTDLGLLLGPATILPGTPASPNVLGNAAGAAFGKGIPSVTPALDPAALGAAAGAAFKAGIPTLLNPIQAKFDPLIAAGNLTVQGLDRSIAVLQANGSISADEKAVEVAQLEEQRAAAQLAIDTNKWLELVASNASPEAIAAAAKTVYDDGTNQIVAAENYTAAVAKKGLDDLREADAQQVAGIERGNIILSHSNSMIDLLPGLSTGQRDLMKAGNAAQIDGNKTAIDQLKLLELLADPNTTPSQIDEQNNAILSDQLQQETDAAEQLKALREIAVEGLQLQEIGVDFQKAGIEHSKAMIDLNPNLSSTQKDYQKAQLSIQEDSYSLQQDSYKLQEVIAGGGTQADYQRALLQQQQDSYKLQEDQYSLSSKQLAATLAGNDTADLQALVAALEGLLRQRNLPIANGQRAGSTLSSSYGGLAARARANGGR